MNITLIGMSGAGKSSIRKLVAERMKLSYLDIDDELEKEQRMTLSEMIAAWGDERFIAEETRLLIEMTSGKDGLLISPGGSVVYSPHAMAHVRQVSNIVYLKVAPEIILERIGNTGRIGRLVRTQEKSLEALIAERVPLYEKFADYTIDTGQLTVDETVVAVVAHATMQSHGSR